MRPHLSKYWKIPPEADAAFAAAMEDVLDVCQMPHDPQVPLICMDESSKQLIGEVRAPIAVAPGHGQIIDHEYVRNGVVSLFVEVEPLSGRQDFAHFIKAMLDERHPQAAKVRLVMDNLNTHNVASLYETFAPAEARRLAQKLEIHHTPRRIPTVEQMRREIAAW